ncbi:hypothetical protein [Roseivirga sp. UBA1976]|uniref:hypothetical protein n=1 Tax=Roseivirga sp. UBA1976 TaxID=1947386 RepID=UPI0025807AF5|nr:hypothetical protein [Roseivirga sp. UBA1976]MEC7755017.1 hypothetical protein [Bacteroidota bacterium]
MGNPQVIEVDIVIDIAFIGEVDVDEAKDQKILPLVLMRKKTDSGGLLMHCMGF